VHFFGKVYESNHILLYVEARLQGYVVLCRYFWKQGMGFGGRNKKPITSIHFISIDLVIHGVGFFFTLTVLLGACISRTSENSLLKMSSFSLGSSKRYITCHGAILRSSINFCCKDVLKEQWVVKIRGGLGTKSLSSRRIGRWSEKGD
jgi:hypothetical protein